MKKKRPYVTVFKVALFVTVAIAGFGQAVHQLWNWLIPSLFAARPISFWQSVGLMALCWILFGGWRGFGGPRRGGRRRLHRRSFERWNQMTPEEREKLREGLRSCRSARGFAQMDPVTQSGDRRWRLTGMRSAKITPTAAIHLWLGPDG